MSPLRALLATALVASTVVALPSAVRADGYFVFPEFGVGIGQTNLDGETRSTAQLDFNIGGEWSRGDVAALGGMLHLGFVDTNERRVPYPWSRFSLAPMLTLSAGYGDISPFARVGVGPVVTFARSDYAPSSDLGAGVLLEGAVGFKSLIELFVDVLGAADGRGLAVGYTAGLRLNALIALDLFGDFGFLFGRHQHSHDAPRTPMHRAVPATPSAPVPHKALPAGAP